MNVYSYIMDKLKNEKMHMGLIDPDEQEPIKAGGIAAELELAGSDAIMVGGSTGLDSKNVYLTIKEIKRKVSIPVIIFPTSAGSLSPNADAIYFMSMLNSQDREKIIGEQLKGAPIVKEMGIEPISMAYLIVEPGMTVGEVGNADMISRDDISTAVHYSLAAQYLGMKLVYLESGSGAPEPVPNDMISAVSSETDIPLVVGGGISDVNQALSVAESGADIIVTGTLIEEAKDIKRRIEGLISKIKEL